MATLALAELWGMTGDEEIKPVLKKAIDLIISCQNREGGWRYEPQPDRRRHLGHDHAGDGPARRQERGMHVPDETMKKAIDYIKRCYDPHVGGFTYQPGSRPGFARTAAGRLRPAADRRVRGEGDPQGRRVPRRATSTTASTSGTATTTPAHAMHQVGGKDWEDWYDRHARARFCRARRRRQLDVRRPRRGRPGVPDVASRVIILSVPTNYLPIFQR